MRAIDRVPDAIDATLIPTPAGHAVAESYLVLGVSGLDGRLPIVQVRKEGLLREGVVEDARLLREDIVSSVSAKRSRSLEVWRKIEA